ncbi:type II secretion system protein [Rugamonas sp. CCM 8940]|uniref:type II secretion system protein n=1 Tax=Rugamonas sp. CCM 8940 TaxID=2765359 RepID=UPI0018F2B6B8|nr:type II secretion system protein [Rugamonas sp. CCM 8940]MBJ7311484.1 type II secretion system protein [Rugamonas sp. CCM 8940]
MRREQGFSYVVVMFLVAIVALLTARALENVLTTARRDKEAELLWVGRTLRDAIGDYHRSTPGSDKKYPKKLADLLDDKRDSGAPRRSLRKVYRDPISGAKEWGEVRTENGELIGVFSLSTQRPLRRKAVGPDLPGFDDAESYQQWRFIYEAN